MAAKKHHANGKKPGPLVRKKRSLTRGLLRMLDLPEETERSVPKLTLVGMCDLLVENHSGVLHCAKEQIRLITQAGLLEIQGTDLTLSEMANGRAYVQGRITGIAYRE